jgi:hypothetical protein
MSNTKLALSFRIFKNGQLVREDKLTQGVIKIGKVPSAHLRIDDESVSRMHAVVEVTNQVVSLIDLGSTRGTFVNGKKINKAVLQSGDVITVGDAQVELAIGEPAEPVRRPVDPTWEASGPAGSAVVASTPRASSSLHEPVAVRPPPPPPQVALRSVPAPGAESQAAVSSAAPPAPAPSTPVATTAGAWTPSGSPGAALPIDTAANPAALHRALAESADEQGGARSVEVAAMLGDTVIGVKHCIDPRSGKVTPTTWAFVAAGAACLLASAIAFTVSVRTSADNTARRERWTHVDHKPERAFRPELLGPGVDWLAFGGLALGLVGVTLGLWRMRGERTSPYYRIGTAPGVELATEHAPLPAFPLVAPSGDDFVFNFGAGIDGELILDGKATPLAELAAAGRSRPSATTAGAIEVAIPPNARIRARAGQTTFVVSAVARPRRHATPLLAGLESRALSYVAGSLAIHLGIWAFLQTIPAEAAGVSIDLGQLEDPSLRVRMPTNEDPLPEQITESGTSGANGKQPDAQMKLPSGASGNPEATQVSGHMEVKLRDNQPRLSNDKLRDEVIEHAIRDGILGSTLLISSIKVLGATSDFASGFDPRDINGSIYGADGEGRGVFGGGTSGLFSGGGCPQEPCGIIGTRPGYGTINLGPAKGPWGAGPNGGLPLRDHLKAVPYIGTPVTSTPTYDKSIVRRYIRRHLNEISYCYEKQLLAHPNLGGEVNATFFIGPKGAVQTSTGTGFDGEVTSCLAGVIKTIEFPPPGDGGVQVNYPFHFHAPSAG